MKKPITMLLLSLCAATLSAQELNDLTPILLPIVINRPNEIVGADDARFSTVVGLQTSVEGLRYYPSYGPPDGSAAVATLERSALRQPFQAGPPSHGGRFLYVDRGGSDSIWVSVDLFSRRGADVDRVGLTRLPIVRENDFRSGVVQIVGIWSLYRTEGTFESPVAVSLFRHALRIYASDLRGAGEVMVRTYDQSSAAGTTIPLSESKVVLDRRDGQDSSYPFYAELTLDELCNPFSLHTPCGGGVQRVEIMPLATGLRYWAMVSGTDNVTQAVTITYPQ